MCKCLLNFSSAKTAQLGQAKDQLDRIGGISMAIDKIAVLLAVIGALNWGGIGLFGFDAVAWLFGGQTAVFSRIIYALVGLAGLWCLTLLFRLDRETAAHPA